MPTYPQLLKFEWRQPDRRIGLPKEQDAGIEKIAGERRRSNTRPGQLTLPLRELVREVLFDTVIVSGLEGECR